MVDIPEIPESDQGGVMKVFNTIPAWVMAVVTAFGILFSVITNYNRIESNSSRIQVLESKNLDFRVTQLESEFTEIKVTLSEMRKDTAEQNQSLNAIKISNAGIEERLKFIFENQNMINQGQNVINTNQQRRK